MVQVAGDSMVSPIRWFSDPNVVSHTGPKREEVALCEGAGGRGTHEPLPTCKDACHLVGRLSWRESHPIAFNNGLMFRERSLYTHLLI